MARLLADLPSYIYGTPQVVATGGSTSRPENLTQLIEHTRDPQPLPDDLVQEIFGLQRRWSDDMDVHAKPWTM
ncbi:MAG: hypothetical protein ABJA87_07385 [bacterium]